MANNESIGRRPLVIGLVAIVVIGLLAAIVKRPSDDRAPFRPYIVSEEHKFYEHGRFGDPTYPPEEITTFNVGKLSPHSIDAIMSGKFYADRGWDYRQYWHDRMLWKSATNPGGLPTIISTQPNSTLISDFRPNANVIEVRPLSNIDVLLLRLKRLGRPPFDEPELRITFHAGGGRVTVTP
jgi:hypothetical protein